jgi:hypothetical protein
VRYWIFHYSTSILNHDDLYMKFAILIVSWVLLAQAVLAQVDSVKMKHKAEYEKSRVLPFEKQKKDLQDLLNMEGLPEIKLQPQIAPLKIIIDRQLEAESLIVGDESETDQSKRRLKGPTQFDSRIEVRKLDPLVDWQNRILNNTYSVALVIRKENMELVTDTMFRIGTAIRLGEKYNLCPGEAFSSQPIAGIGTAFMTGEQEFMSACHVFEDSISHYAIVFGFEMTNKVGAFETYIPVRDVYYPSEIIYKDEELDVITIRLDRQTNRPILKLFNGPVSKGTEIYMIGYPCGLPQKIALNARVFSDDELYHFYTTLDAFQGNSGSPVFSMDTHEVIGILVSGEVDYVWNGGCNQTTICRLPFCKGERAVRITEIMKAIQNNQGL